MTYISLREFIDDILLIVRNNNISESEDLSREQLSSWILSYKALLANRQEEKIKDTGSDPDDSLTTTVGPCELQDVKSNEDKNLFTKRTVKPVPELLGDSDENLISVFDEDGCTIQRMSRLRRHFHYFRKYTFAELTYFYQDGYIYVQGQQDNNKLKYIYYTGIFAGDDTADENDITIPGWMIPEIRKMIFQNELSFMLQRPSDDDNNATLASVKPHGPQDQES